MDEITVEEFESLPLNSRDKLVLAGACVAAFAVGAGITVLARKIKAKINEARENTDDEGDL